MKSLIPRGLLLAKNVSLYSDFRYRVGAVIAKKRPISVGFNQVKTHPLYSNNLATTIHAEMNALIHAQFDDLVGATIYVYREDRCGNFALARPCSNCLRELKKKGLKKMVYTTNIYPFHTMERI